MSADHWSAEAERVEADIRIMGESDDGRFYVWEPCLFCDDGHWRLFTWWKPRHIKAHRLAKSTSRLSYLTRKATR